jgi:endonuclease/exonuclease/phosphatase family metal-dependent hydrolase
LPQTRPHIIGRMRFATFNVLHGRPIKNGRLLPVPAGGAAAEPLAEAVASLDADVLAVQEVDRLQERSGRVDQALVAARALHAKDWRYAAARHGRSVPGTGWVPDPAAPRLRVYGPEDAAAVGDLPSHGIALLPGGRANHSGRRQLLAVPVPNRRGAQRIDLRRAGRAGQRGAAAQRAGRVLPVLDQFVGLRLGVRQQDERQCARRGRPARNRPVAVQRSGAPRRPLPCDDDA